MQKDPYLILGVSQTAKENEVKAAYERLKSIYRNQLFLEGEAGMEASRKLSELDVALADILENLKKKETAQSFGSEFGAIENLIKTNNLSSAQNLLDAMDERSAEWHYYQSIVYYRKDWVSESRKQLIMAVNMEPDNKKYQEALARMEAVLEHKSNPFNQQYGSGQTVNGDPNAQQQRGGYNVPPQQQARGGGLSDVCCMMWPTLCCCGMYGCTSCCNR